MSRSGFQPDTSPKSSGTPDRHELHSCRAKPPNSAQGQPNVDVRQKDRRLRGGTGLLHFIEGKNPIENAPTVTITTNEIQTGFHTPDDFLLAFGLIDVDHVELRDIRRPFRQEPDLGVTSVNDERAA